MYLICIELSLLLINMVEILIKFNIVEEILKFSEKKYITKANLINQFYLISINLKYKHIKLIISSNQTAKQPYR
jgi:hypothetical protein